MRYCILFLLMITLPLTTLSQAKSKANIINYFASNNQIVGVPMLDMENQFRFYPDLSFQEAITGIEVYYFVLNDVYKNHLTRRQEGRFWEGSLREFALGESIQRVEVVVDCDRAKLKGILANYGFDPLIINKDEFHYYLFLRRGDDNSLYSLNFYQTIKANTAGTVSALNAIDSSSIALKASITRLISDIAATRTTVDITTITDPALKADVESIVKSKFDLAALKTELTSGDSMVINRRLKEIRSQLQAELRLKLVNEARVSSRTDSLRTASIIYETRLKQISDAANNYYERFNDVPVAKLPPDLFRNKDVELLKNIPVDAASRPYYSYIENRVASMLDMRYKEGTDKIIQFNYRNDKQSLQYLQADDPQEKLGIFRARLVPFPFYTTSGSQNDFKWQQSKVIYEIGINFGYTIVKGDHFTPKFFDMNRMGLGIGISADTFGPTPTFLSVSLTYDMNTYTSLSFGANLVSTPGFYMGVGINARAFKDLVKNSATLFK